MSVVLVSEALIPVLGSLDIGDRSGKTALHHAAYSGHLEMLSLLQLKGANVKAVDKREKAPLHLAAFMGKFWAHLGSGVNGVHA